MVTRMAGAVAPETPHADATVNVAFAAGIVPEGKPEPVMLTAEVPLAPELGEVDAVNVTDCAFPALAAAKTTTAPTITAAAVLLMRFERTKDAAKVGTSLRRRNNRPSRPPRPTETQSAAARRDRVSSFSCRM